MDRKIQILLSLAVVATVILVTAYLAGWFREMNSCEIDCSLIHEEGAAIVSYHVWTSEVGTLAQEVDEERGEIGEGQIVGLVLNHEWEGASAKTLEIHVRLTCQQGGDEKVYWGTKCLSVFPESRHRLDCHIILNDSEGVSERGLRMEDVYTVYSSNRGLFSQEGAGCVKVNLHNEDTENVSEFIVLIDGEWRSDGSLGPLSTLEIEIEVAWDWPVQNHTLHIQVFSGDASAVHDDLIVLQDNATVAVPVTI